MYGRVSEVIARPVRTAGQLGAGAVITEFFDAFVRDLTDKQYAAMLGLLTLLIGAGQVAYENWKGKALLRSVPPKEVPVSDTGGTGASEAPRHRL